MPLLAAVLSCAWPGGDADHRSGYCLFPRFLQDVERTSADHTSMGLAWISRTLYVGESDSWTRRTIVTVHGGVMRFEHRLHASCRCSRLTFQFSVDFDSSSINVLNEQLCPAMLLLPSILGTITRQRLARPTAV